MRAFLKVFKFEFNNYLQNKIYVVTTVLATLVFALLMCIPTFISIFGADNNVTPDLGTGDIVVDEKDEPVGDYDEVYAIYDPNGLVTDFTDLCDAFSAEWINVGSEAELQSKLEAGEIEGGVSLTSASDAKLYVAESGMFEDRDVMFGEVFLNAYRKAALAGLDIDAEVVDPYYNMYMNVEIVALEKDGFAGYMYSYILLFILYFMILMYGNMIATSVTTEKSSRTIEVLVTSTSTNALLSGKVLAGTVASVAQAAIIVGGALGSYTLNRNAWKEIISFNFDIPAEIIVAFAVYGILGYVFYAFIFGMLGALVSKTEDIGKSTGPLQMIFMIGFLVTVYSSAVPDSIWMRVMSHIPFTSCNAMVARIAVGSVSFVEVVISVIILIISNIVIAIVASKIYRMTTLMYGNPIKLKNALKFLKKEK